MGKIYLITLFSRYYMVAKSIQLNILPFLFYYASRLNFLKVSMCAMRKSTTDAVQYFQSVNLIYLISLL